MLFNSSQFLLLFLPLVLLVYYRLNHRAQNTFLIIASCWFYAAWDWRFLLPLLFTTSVDYFVARRMEASRHRGESDAPRKRMLLVSLLCNLGLLGFFKYWNFFLQSASGVLESSGFHVSFTQARIILPVAISFYTFQALSYTIDVYRGRSLATNSFADFFLAVLYFPHLMAGPIQRAASLLPQVTNPRVFRRVRVLDGLHLMTWGYFKKVFIADNLAPVVNDAFSLAHPTGGSVVIGTLAFAIQIYCDFSGYTDIARGIAKLMGFEFQLNFNLPYFAKNPSDFWKRWHISLSSWLRDYLYVSLGGNRFGIYRTYRNLILTMVIGGLWHGAAWNFVLWGLYHGVVLTLHRASSPALSQLTRRFPHRFSHLASILCMFAATCYGWLLFRARSFEQIEQMTRALKTPIAGLDLNQLVVVILYSGPLVASELLQYKSGNLLYPRSSKLPTTIKVIAYSLMLYGMLFAGGTAQPFVYFQF